MKTFCVIYRTGGTANFKWHRSMAVGSMEAAAAILAEVQKGGRTAFVADHAKSLAIRLPETYSAEQSVVA